MKLRVFLCSLFVALCNLSFATPPGLPANVAVTLTTPDPKVGDILSLLVKITPEVDLTNVSVQFEAHGELTLPSHQSIALGAISANSTRELTAEVTLTGAGYGEVYAHVLGQSAGDSVPMPTVGVLNVVARDGEVLSGIQAPIDLEIKDLQKKLKQKSVSQSSYDNRLKKLLSGGAIENHVSRPKQILSPDEQEQIAVVERALGLLPVKEPTGNKGSTITVSGLILWTDLNGITHPARYVSVEVLDVNATGQDSVTMVRTQSNGTYTATIDNNDPEGPGGRDIYIAAHTDITTATNGWQVYNGPTNSTYNITSSLNTDVPDSTTLTINLTANNTDANNRAFAVFDSFFVPITFVNLYYASPPTIPNISKVLAEYPGPNSNTSYFSPADGRLHIADGHWSSPDVLNHEYGHFLMNFYGIKGNVGGPHSINLNLASGRTKQQGMEFAWSEGYPTFFGTRAQQIMFTFFPSFNTSVPNTGDPLYTDNMQNFSYDLEGTGYLDPTGVLSSLATNGEDCEGTVQRFLYDLADGTGEPNDEIQLGISPGLPETEIFQTAYFNGDKSLAPFMQHVFATRFGPYFGDLIESHGLSARPIELPDRSVQNHLVSPPTFTWDDGPAVPLQPDQYVLEFWNYNYSQKLLEIPAINSPTKSFTPDSTQWDQIWSTDSPIINWFILGSNTSFTPTTSYYSSDRSFGGTKLAIFVDTSLGMAGEMPYIKAKLTNMMQSSVGATKLAMELWTRDVNGDIVVAAMTDSSAVMQTAVDALAAVAPDCLSLTGIVKAIQLANSHLVPNSMFLLLTDYLGTADHTYTAVSEKNGVYMTILSTGPCISSKSLADDQGIASLTQLANSTGGVFRYAPETETGNTTVMDAMIQNTILAALRGAVLRVEPSTVYPGAQVTLNIYGANTNFDGTSVVDISGGDIAVNSVTLLSPELMQANITVSPTAFTAPRFVTVITNSIPAMGTNVLNVLAADVNPVIVGISPEVVTAGQTATVTVYGLNTNFDVTSVVTFDNDLNDSTPSGVNVDSVNVISATQLEATITVDAAGADGFHDVMVTTGVEVAQEGVTGPMTVAEAINLTPSLLGVTPDVVMRNTVNNLLVSSENTSYTDGLATVVISGIGVTVEQVSVLSPLLVDVRVNVAVDATLDARDITLSQDGQDLTILGAVTVTDYADIPASDEVDNSPVAHAGNDQSFEVSPGGTVDVTLDGSTSAAPEGTTLSLYNWAGTPDPADVVSPLVNLGAGVYEFTLIVQDSEGTFSEADTITVTITTNTALAHSADQNVNGAISLSELLRVIQFFNIGALHCDPLGEDGFAPGVGDQSCVPHNSDYSVQNWSISLSELLRIIQFFNILGYHSCPTGEDGFCPGP